MGQKLKSSHGQFKKKSKNTIYEQFEWQEKYGVQKKQQYLEEISQKLKLPPDLITGAPIISITGRNRLYLENYKGIIEYNGDKIVISTKLCKITVEGKQLDIDYFTNDEMQISGIIQSIHYK